MTANVLNGTADAARAGTYHRIVWRWHFYAGLFTMPFLVVLATTGLIMLWSAALSGVNGERMAVPATGQMLAPSQLQAAAEAALPGSRAAQYIAPLAEDRVAVFRVERGDDALAALVDPYTGRVVDTLAWDGGLYDLANRIHGTLLIGTLGDRLVETAASLGIIMVLSGLYLHWPRGGRGMASLLQPKLRASGRSFWKSLHGVTGVWMSLVMIVFLVSGLSWSGIWGERIVQAWSTFPAEKLAPVPLSDSLHADMNHGAEKEVPWALEQTPMPASGSLEGANAVPAPVTIDGVAKFAAGLGLPGRFQIALPADDKGVWTLSHDSMSSDGPDPAADRTVHIDRFNGNVLADVPYAEYSAYAKMMAWGIAFHEGELGIWNIALNTLFCLAMVFLPVTGLVLWWKRRPERSGRLTAPPRPVPARFWIGGAVVAMLVGLAFPLAGVAIVLALLFDMLVVRRLQRRATPA